jgi:PAS domain S-box-containing protein
MARRALGTASSLARHSVPTEANGESRDLLRALFKSSTVGVAICDRQLRYTAVNDALASMNGVPAKRHIGETIHALLGRAADKIQPAFEHVFATGQPLSNVDVTAELPSRRGIGHWNESYFPIKDDAGGVQQVGVIVFELTKRKELEVALLRLIKKLARITAALRNNRRARESSGLGCAGLENVCAGPVGLLEGCLSETRAISELLYDSPPFGTVRRLRLARISRGGLAERGQGKDRANVQPIADALEYVSPLSSREREVVALLAIGKTNKEIGSTLLISTRTVESHRARIMLKLDLHSLSDLVLYAVRNHLIHA